MTRVVSSANVDPALNLQRLREWVQTWNRDTAGPAHIALRKALAILDRDLLPRLENNTFIVGFVGPNNAGKSALFNAVLGQTCSPSRAYGGATRRLLAAHGFHGEHTPAVRGFQTVVRVEPGPQGVEAVGQMGVAGELLAVQSPLLPPGLLIVDAPDFDSIMEAHKDSAESLMGITDLAVVVVTRHSYQNLEVVQFLKEWLGTGRPWVLVYNEAPSVKVAREHCDVLASGVGAQPIALFQAPSDIGVAEGIRPLAAVAIDGGAQPGQTFADWIRDLGCKEELQQSAHEASRQRLLEALNQFADHWEGEQSLRRLLHKEAGVAADSLAQQVCMDAMPMGPVLQAFRIVLDRRPGLVRSQLRKGIQQARKGAMFLWAKVGGHLSSVTDPAPANLLQAEREALTPLWSPFFERLEAKLMSAGANSNPDWQAIVEQDLAPLEMDSSRERAFAGLQSDPEVWQEFEQACERFIEEDLDLRGNEWTLQALVDLTHLLPAAVAGAIIVKSGGLLTDVAVGSMGAVSSMAMEQLSKFLGTGTANRARKQWAQLRSPKLREIFLRAALVQGWPLLQQTEQGDPREWTRWLVNTTKDTDHA
ncbi:MAG: hypothetical protein ACI87O_002351 [Planctomycetota bacterium]|jgi:hypothetical protein